MSKWDFNNNIKTVYNPNNEKIYFNENKHLYYDDDKNTYKSVTTLIHDFFPKFNVDYWAKKCSENEKHDFYGLLPEEIKYKWKQNAKISSLFGTKIHKYAELLINDETIIEPNSYKELKYLENLRKFIFAFKQIYDIIEAEKIIFSKKFLVAGTIDLIAKHKKTGHIAILDWKTNKIIKTENKFQNGLYELNHLDDCNFIHYTLQLNIYKKILDMENYFNGPYKMALFHINDVNVRIYKVNDMPRETMYILNNKDVINGK